MVEGPMTLPPHPSTKHCHGHEFGLASVPPTILDTETSGWIAGLPHCPDGVGGSNVGPVGGDENRKKNRKQCMSRPDVSASPTVYIGLEWL